MSGRSSHEYKLGLTKLKQEAPKYLDCTMCASQPQYSSQSVSDSLQTVKVVVDVIHSGSFGLTTWVDNIWFKKPIHNH